MAAINVTLVGMGNGEPFTFIGLASLTGLGVGGGPIIPPDKPPIDPGLHPEHPIVLPKPPQVPPPSIWPPGPGIDFPSHPIVIPPPVDPGQPPIQPGSLITWKAVWVPPAVTGGDGSWMILGTPNVPHPAPG